ncbi:MAG: hypothetical protein QS721_15680 [Candidatus Endonucleobacter sp. (ex Gigantidas childressi)]|nr:hypothetical protein [Candidatus Endonucleobacter sp. (ex Gigantidas childressi)]
MSGHRELSTEDDNHPSGKDKKAKKAKDQAKAKKSIDNAANPIIAPNNTSALVDMYEQMH